jgi:AcrR family transcriptional regulator
LRARSVTPVSVDGRARRSQRSRAAIVQAVFDLVGEGVVQPTAQQVAERAEVGLRSVFRHFSDMESLLAEVDQRVRAQALPLLELEPPRGTRAERAHELIARRVQLFERIAPYKRSGSVHRWRSPFVARNHAELARALRAAMLRSLPELRDAPADVVEALDAALSFETWDRLRTDQRLGRERASAALERTVFALLSEVSS